MTDRTAVTKLTRQLTEYVMSDPTFGASHAVDVIEAITSALLTVVTHVTIDLQEADRNMVLKAFASGLSQMADRMAQGEFHREVLTLRQSGRTIH